MSTSSRAYGYDSPIDQLTRANVPPPQQLFTGDQGGCRLCRAHLHFRPSWWPSSPFPPPGTLSDGRSSTPAPHAPLVLSESLQHLLGGDRQRSNAYADGIVDGVGDGRGHGQYRRLADATGAKRPFFIGFFHDDRLDQR